MKIKDRIKELRRVRASQLIPNPKNWRMHTHEQSEAMRGILDEVGYAGAALAYETPEGLMLIDGHLRAETTPDQEIPVLVLDVNKEEADKLLATYDPLGAMAEANKDKLAELLKDVEVMNGGLNRMLAELSLENELMKEGGEYAESSINPEYPIVPMAGEKYDYVMILCGNESDFAWLQTRLNIERSACYKKANKIGVGRVITVEQFRNALEQKQPEVANAA